ncbi:class I SAM-dependent DNA methyltransferase [Pelagicoccus sp. SDUM812003]|uniref:class I SAM-dependent DNA methyltransferase n=1 Tax=Pelagicoccus sp. SDUM812003 TaxID=3041267 RepID=UPI0028106E69|nr:class I SAM-dependent DNA methyltransferase [Pelagicoccus sp. SDUM812003]MDQ8201495.1 class I SAM-dependent DNA methyltransferase [Pelagicoccus sp. SDUM812003]
MALKKSELYSSLWQSCDELRGGMDASQYKDYVLVLLFLKYISDKYAGQPYAPIVIPDGASFADMVKLKGKTDIGDQINKRIIAPLAAANEQLSQADFPDFNDANKLGSGKEIVDRLTNLISIFQKKELDFSRNRAEGDDILGDAYEYLMRHFATESGKSKGQFYTPAEVSRVMAAILGIHEAQTTNATTVYDPTCGSGSLLLKVAGEADSDITIYGQEKDSTTAQLARMNMILHDRPTATVRPGNTLANPKFLQGDALQTFDFVVANPPFSDKRWTSGLHPDEIGVPADSDSVDQASRNFHRFDGFGVPPAKQGDYAYLLHIVRSMKSTAKGACILPHGVLFRGNAEAAIRRELVKRGLLAGIIGLPANLFYGTGIPACIIVLDKEHAQERRPIFMIDASSGFMKDGNKNRLRSMDIHKIVDVFKKRIALPGYAREVPFEEIEKNDFNLNLPRYIDSQAKEDIQDIEAHLRGGIPQRDIDALDRYWQVCPSLKSSLFKGRAVSPRQPQRAYSDLTVTPDQIKPTIQSHKEFASFIASLEKHFAAWRKKASAQLKQLDLGFHPKTLIHELSEDLLEHYADSPLIDRYDVYQHLMDFWEETMQDDCYLITQDGWIAKPERILEEITKGKKKGQTVDKGWTCELVPKPLIVARYFAAEQAELEALQSQLEAATARLKELEEEQSGDDGAFSDLDKVNKANVTARLKELGIKGGARRPGGRRSASTTQPDLLAAEESASYGSETSVDEVDALLAYLESSEAEAALKKQIKQAESELDALALAHYPKLTPEDIKTLVVDDKWLATLATAIHGETDRISQSLTQRVKDLAERYAQPLPELTTRVTDLESKVSQHLERMGFAWQ